MFSAVLATLCVNLIVLGDQAPDMLPAGLALACVMGDDSLTANYAAPLREWCNPLIRRERPRTVVVAIADPVRRRFVLGRGHLCSQVGFSWRKCIVRGERVVHSGQL